MQCEICEKAVEAGKRIRLEGSVVVACEQCSRYGEIVEETVLPKPTPKVVQKKPQVTDTSEFSLGIVEELVDNYPEKIKNKRESLGMKQEDLAKKINEPTSLVHRIESNRFEPSPKLARKIQSALKIKLLEKSGNMEQSQKTNSDFPDTLTLGDLIVVKKRQKE